MYLCIGVSCLGGFKFLVLPSSRCPPPEKAWQYILHHSQVMTQHSASTHLKRIVSLHSLPLLVFLHTYTLSHHFVKLQKFLPLFPRLPHPGMQTLQSWKLPPWYTFVFQPGNEAKGGKGLVSFRTRVTWRTERWWNGFNCTWTYPGGSKLQLTTRI